MVSERPTGRKNPDIAPTDTDSRIERTASLETNESHSEFQPGSEIEPISAIESASRGPRSRTPDVPRPQGETGKAAAGKSVSVGRKIGYVVALCLALAATVAGAGITQLYSIGTELEGIAERDVPMTTAVTAITVHQLEQAIYFERAMRFGVQMQTNPDVRPKFEKTTHHFEELSQKVNKELKQGEALAKFAAETAATAEARKEFQHVLEQLTKIEHEHTLFEEHVREAFKLVSAGEMAKSEKLAEKIVAEEDKLDRELEALLVEIEKFTENAAKTAEAHEKTAVNLMIAISLIGFVVVGFLAWRLVSRNIARPLAEVTHALEALNAGDTSVEIIARNNDEIGTVANALGAFKESMIANERLRQEQAENDRRMAEERERSAAEVAKAEKERLEAENRAREEKARVEQEKLEAEAKAEKERLEAEAQRAEEKREAEAQREAEKREAEERAREEKLRLEEEQRKAEADAQERAEKERRESMMELARSFENKVGNVIESVAASSGEMKSAAQAMSSTADLTNQQSTTVAATSEQASGNVQMVAAATEELAASVTEISRQVSQSASMAREAVSDASQTDENIQGLAEAANRIGEVINMINDIASQTNLLALNATIEAARAGDAGKGFAVVASEVKSLADQTAKATDEIASQIGGMQNATTEAVSAVRQIGKKIGEIDEISSAIAAAVEEQGASTNEIAKNVQQAATGTQAVSDNIAQVTQGAGETGAAANQVLSTAENLSVQSDELRSSVENFLDEVRAA